MRNGRILCNFCAINFSRNCIQAIDFERISSHILFPSNFYPGINVQLSNVSITYAKLQYIKSPNNYISYDYNDLTYPKYACNYAISAKMKMHLQSKKIYINVYVYLLNSTQNIIHLHCAIYKTA